MDNKCSRDVYSKVSIVFATEGDVKNREISLEEAMEFENTIENNSENLKF